MSWARMNRKERPRYLMGEAIMRHRDDTSAWPMRAAEFEAIRTVLTRRLSDDEVMEVFSGTGWDIDGWLEDDPGDPDQMALEFPPPSGFSDEDIPF